MKSETLRPFRDLLIFLLLGFGTYSLFKGWFLEKKEKLIQAQVDFEQHHQLPEIKEQDALTAQGWIKKFDEMRCVLGGTVTECMQAPLAESDWKDKGWEWAIHFGGSWTLTRHLTGPNALEKKYTWRINAHGEILPMSKDAIILVVSVIDHNQ
ncbi:MAG: hypothetical protein HQL54_04020 [Magnetococcales bacterium]|nr:hypothetical protein [Magnetococcales bacterium]